MSLDHGVLNVPLSKRGNIDAKLDAYKRDQVREERQLRKALAYETKCLRKRAKAVVSGLSDERVAHGSKVAGLTPAQFRKRLMSDAHWQPNIILRAYGEQP